jgi:hypothetical protein
MWNRSSQNLSPTLPHPLIPNDAEIDAAYETRGLSERQAITKTDEKRQKKMLTAAALKISSPRYFDFFLDS